MSPGIRRARWNDIPRKKVTDAISRRVFTGERMMIAHVYLDKGAIVPTHRHENEQLSYVLDGALRLWIGADDAPDREELVLRTGEVLCIPSNVPHKAEALEDSFDVDVFSPPRQDWLDGSDSYLHNDEK